MKMSRPDCPDRFSNFRSAFGVSKTRQQHQQFACDRCRGQKLRCIRTPNIHPSCERCQKAGATCVVNPSVRMGRPQRTNKERRESTSSSHKSQSTLSPNFTTNGSIWLGNDLEEAMDSSLENFQYQDFLDFGLHNAALEDDQLRISPSEDFFDDPFNFASPQTSGMPTISSTDELGTEDTSGTPQPSPFISLEPVTISNIIPEKGNIEDILELGDRNNALTMLQESVERVSNLNLELRRQLSITSQIATDCKNIEPSLAESPNKNDGLSCSINFMIQGLQTFHDLLLEILGSSNKCPSRETASHTTMYNSQNHRLPMQNTFSKFCPASLLDFTGIRDIDLVEPISRTRNEQQTVPQADANSRSDHIQDDPSQITLIDMSTSLLIISCYINLIHLSRDVFAAIRGALNPPGHQRTLLALSSFQISGVPIHQDSDLQIIILTQVVVRLVNRIGLSLGHPHDPTAKANKGDEARLCSKAILPQLLDYVLRQEGTWGQTSCKGGVEALREEIRRLNEVVYKPV